MDFTKISMKIWPVKMTADIQFFPFQPLKHAVIDRWPLVILRDNDVLLTQ